MNRLILSPQEIKEKNSKKPFFKYLSYFEAYDNADSNGIFKHDIWICPSARRGFTKITNFRILFILARPVYQMILFFDRKSPNTVTERYLKLFFFLNLILIFL